MKRAFSLIELMVVVAILSLAAAILVPRFLKDQETHKETVPSEQLSKIPE